MSWVVFSFQPLAWNLLALSLDEHMYEFNSYKNISFDKKKFKNQ